MPTILVADDNSNIQKMVTLALKSEGIDVVAVGNGEAAVKKTIEIVPDLVLADIFMPVRSGYEVCEFLKQDSRFSHIPVVLLAGAFDPFDEKEAQRVGADGVLKKPFVPPDPLVALVKGLLAKNGEHLVTVSAPAQATPVSAQGSGATPEASASSAPSFTPPAFVPAPDAGVKKVDFADDDSESTTTIAPMRDFVVPVAPPEPEHKGGADAFGSMMDTSPLGAVMPPMRADGAPKHEEQVGEDREIEPASTHSAFEGFSPWRASAASAGVVEEEASQNDNELSNQFMPSSKDLMGRVWDLEPSLADKSPDETVIEPLDGISPLTHSAQHVTSVRQEVRDVAETPAAETNTVARPSEILEQSAIEDEKAEPNNTSGVSDWRSAFVKAPEVAAQIVESPASPSMSPWQIPIPPVESPERDNFAEPSNSSEDLEVRAVHSISDTVIESEPSVFAAYRAANDSATSVEAEASAEGTAHIVDDFAPLVAHTESVTAPSMEVAEHAAAEDAQESAWPAARPEAETSDWIAELPAQLSPEDTTAVARSVVEKLAPGAVESVASSFPVPAGGASDPGVVEDIVARVVERMQPQILELISREVLRPVVEALVRRQLEEKLPE